MNGLDILTWLLCLAFLYACFRVAVFMHQAHEPVDEWCSDIDTVVDMQDAHDARMRREARV